MIAIIKLKDGNDIITYYVKQDEDFEENLVKLEKLTKNYSNFQEIEDFMFENFTNMELDEYEFEY